MIYRTRDAALHNLIVNKPEVRRTFGIYINDPRPITFDEHAQRDDYFLLTNGKNACAIMDMVSPAVYDGHSLFDPACRGRDAIEQGREIIAWMWKNTQAQIIVGKTPAQNRAARMFNRWVGFTSDGTGTFESVDGGWECEWFHILRAAV